MSNLYVSSEYKNKIINLLCANENFISLLNPSEPKSKELDVIDVILGGEWVINGERIVEQGHVFDYDFVNETTTEKRTFVFVETDIDSIKDNIFTDFNLYICVFTDKDLVRLTTSSTPTAKQVKEMGYFASKSRGNRIDVLCDCIDKILNGTDKLIGIGDVKPAPRSHMVVFKPNQKYYGKCLKYHIYNYNAGQECDS